MDTIVEEILKFKLFNKKGMMTREKEEKFHDLLSRASSAQLVEAMSVLMKECGE